MSDIQPNDNKHPLEGYLSSISHNLKGPLPFGLKATDCLILELVEKFSDNSEIESSKIFLLAYSSWRNSVALAQGGASSQVPICLRHSIECGLHAYLFAREPIWAETWWKREIDPTAKKKLRDGRNGPLKVAKSLLKIENERVYNNANDFTEMLIDFGAHPNIFQLIDVYHEAVDHENGFDELRVSFLSSNENRERAFVKCGSAGLILADLFRIIWPDLANDTRVMKLQMEAVGQMRVYSNAVYKD